MKKILSLVIGLIIVIGMVGCSTTEQAVNDAKQDVVENTTDLESMDKYVKDLLSKAFVDGDVSVSTTKDKDIYVTTIAIIDNNINLQGLSKEEIQQVTKKEGLTDKCDKFVKQVTEYYDKQGIDTNILFKLTDGNWISAYEFRYDNLQNTDEQSNNTKKTTDKRDESSKKTSKKTTKDNRSEEQRYLDNGYLKDGTHLGEMNNGCEICGIESNNMTDYKGMKLCNNCATELKCKDNNKKYKQKEAERERERQQQEKDKQEREQRNNDSAYDNSNFYKNVNNGSDK